MKRMQPKLESLPKGGQRAADLQKSLDALKESVKSYEDQYGEVKISGPQSQE